MAGIFDEKVVKVQKKITPEMERAYKRRNIIKTIVGLFAGILGAGTGVLIFNTFFTKEISQINPQAIQLRDLTQESNKDGVTTSLHLHISDKINIGINDIKLTNLDNPIVPNIIPKSIKWNGNNDLVIKIEDDGTETTTKWRSYDDVSLTINTNENIVNNGIKCSLSNNDNPVLIKSFEPILNTGKTVSAFNLVLSKEIVNLTRDNVKVAIIPQTSLLTSKNTSGEEDSNLVEEVTQNSEFKNMYTIKIKNKIKDKVLTNKDKVSIKIDHDRVYVPQKNNIANLFIDFELSNTIRLRTKNNHVLNKQLNNKSISLTDDGKAKSFEATKEIFTWDSATDYEDMYAEGDKKLRFNSRIEVVLQKLKDNGDVNVDADWEPMNKDDSSSWKLQTSRDTSSFSHKYIKITEGSNSGEFIIELDNIPDMLSNNIPSFNIYLEIVKIDDESQTLPFTDFTYYPIINTDIIDHGFLKYTYDAHGNKILYDIDFRKIEEVFKDNKYTELQIPSDVTQVSLHINIKEHLRHFLSKKIKKLSFIGRMFLKNPKPLTICENAFNSLWSLEEIDDSIGNANVISIEKHAFYHTPITSWNFNLLKSLEFIDEDFCSLRDYDYKKHFDMDHKPYEWFPEGFPGDVFDEDGNLKGKKKVKLSNMKFRNINWQKVLHKMFNNGNVDQDYFTLDMSDVSNPEPINLSKGALHLVNLDKIILPYTITDIKENAFLYQPNLHTVEIAKAPAGEKEKYRDLNIDSGAFGMCPRLNTIDLGDKNTGEVADDFMAAHPDGYFKQSFDVSNVAEFTDGAVKKISFNIDDKVGEEAIYTTTNTNVVIDDITYNLQGYEYKGDFVLFSNSDNWEFSKMFILPKFKNNEYLIEDGKIIDTYNYLYKYDINGGNAIITPDSQKSIFTRDNKVFEIIDGDVVEEENVGEIEFIKRLNLRRLWNHSFPSNYDISSENPKQHLKKFWNAVKLECVDDHLFHAHYMVPNLEGIIYSTGLEAGERKIICDDIANVLANTIRANFNNSVDWMRSANHSLTGFDTSINWEVKLPSIPQSTE